jgi:hypothetical protein
VDIPLRLIISRPPYFHSKLCIYKSQLVVVLKAINRLCIPLQVVSLAIQNFAIHVMKAINMVLFILSQILICLSKIPWKARFYLYFVV